MKHVGISQSATPATQNDMTACFETFNKDGFCSFPHRHCDGTIEASDSRQDMLEQQNERFVRDFLKLQVAASKSTFSYEFSFEPTSKSTFRARLPSIFMTCHKMPRLPRNLHLVTTSRSADNAIRKNHAARDVESVAPATQNDIGGVQSAAPATKNATHLLKM